MNKQRVFVSGVAGFLGSHLADAFLADGHDVVGIDNLIGGGDSGEPASKLARRLTDSKFVRASPDVAESLPKRTTLQCIPARDMARASAAPSPPLLPFPQRIRALRPARSSLNRVRMAEKHAPLAASIRSREDV